MSSRPNRKILVTLDSLQDTFLSTLYLANPEATMACLENGKYHRRFSNRASLLDNRFDDKEVERLWKNRGMETLMSSVCTGIVQEIQKTVKEARTGEESPTPTKVEIHVDYAPYPLEDGEVAQYAHILGNLFVCDALSMVSYGTANLTPAGLSGYDICVYHEYNDWFTTHVNTLPNGEMHEVEFCFPELVSAKMDEWKDELRGYLAFHAVSLMSEFCRPKCMPLALYSARHN